MVVEPDAQIVCIDCGGRAFLLTPPPEDGQWEIGEDQFLHFQALDDECPQECSMPVLTEMRPALAAPLRQSRQYNGTMPRDLIRSITGPCRRRVARKDRGMWRRSSSG